MPQNSDSIKKDYNPCQSAVTPLMKQAVGRHKFFFFFLYPHLFEMEVGKDGFVVFRIAPLTWKLIPWFLSVSIVTGLCGFGSCMYICLMQIFRIETQPWIKWNMFNTLIILGLGTAAAIEIFGCILLYRNPVVFAAISALLDLEHKCFNSIGQSQSTGTNENQIRCRRELLANEFSTFVKRSAIPIHIRHRIIENDTLGYLLNLMVIFGTVLGLPVAIVAVAAQLDPFYFVLEQNILPNPYNRSLKIIVLVPILRIFLSYLCIIEFIRIGEIAIFAMVIVVFVAVSISKTLAQVFYDNCLFLHTQLRLIFLSIKAVVDTTVAVLIFGGQFATCLTLWVVFKCLNLLPIYLYIVVCFLSMYMIVLITLLLPAATKVRMGTRSLIRNKLNLHHCTNRHNGRKLYYFSLWRSQNSVYFCCYSYFIIQKGVTMAFMKELINNLVNAVLLINPIDL